MEIKFVRVIGFRTEDPEFPTANLLRGGKWLSEKKSRSCVNDVTLQLDKIHVINDVDIGNAGSAFVSVEVSRIGLQSFETLLPSTELMSARDTHTKKNWNCVKMFSQEDLTPGVRDQKWDLVRVVCMQPFLAEEQFGLTFVKIFSVSQKNSQCSKSESPPPSRSWFAKVSNHTLMKVVPMPVNRSEQMLQAAMKQQNKQKSDNSEYTTNTNLFSKMSTNSRTATLQSSKNSVPESSSSELSFKMLPSCKSTEGSHHEVSSGHISHEVKILSPLSRKRREFALQPLFTKCKRSNHCNEEENKQVANLRGRRKPLDEEIVHITSDSDSDDAVIENTDSDTSTLILPLKEGKNTPSDAARSLSPLRLQRDFDSDTETVIVPANFQTTSPPRKIASELHKPLPFQCNQMDKRKPGRQKSFPCRKEMGLKKDIPLVPSSTKNSSRLKEVPSLKCEEETRHELGCSRVKCPLCSVCFEISEIEQHAANCMVDEEP